MKGVIAAWSSFMACSLQERSWFVARLIGLRIDSRIGLAV